MKKPKNDPGITLSIIVFVVAIVLAVMSLITLNGFIPINDTPNKINGNGKEKTFMNITKCQILGNDMHRISITNEEFNLMASVVMAEAEGEPYEAQEAVAQTILNRWLCEDKFPDTITGVIQDPGAYTTSKEEPTVSCYLAVRNAIEYYNTAFMNYPKTMYYFRDTHYHTFGLPYTTIGNLYFSLAEDATD